MYKDYAMQRADFVEGEIVPRLLRTEIGDIFTTNTFGPNTSDVSTVSGPTLSVGDLVTPGTNGYLTSGTTASAAPVFAVVKEYNLGDMQPAVKLQRVK